MLENWIRPQRPEEAELEERLKAANEKLSRQQMMIKERGLPVLVLFEGWGTAGKGSVLGKVIRNIDPRFFKVAAMEVPTPEERRKPFLYRYFVKIPEAGKFMFLDSGWMDEVTGEYLDGTLKEKEYKKKIESVRRFERQLTDNGYLVMKFFFHISRKEQKKRIDALRSDKNTSWRVGERDGWQNRHYDKCLAVFDRYLNDTNAPADPWYVIDAKSRKWAQLQVLETLVCGIDTALGNSAMAVPLLQNVFPLERMPKLDEIDLDRAVTQEEYRAELDRLQEKLGHLHNKLYRKKVPVIIAYEGWDAAGKGGNIKRITEAVFDRTWYGRVMVERLEGFCRENDWQRAYNEINEFEKELADWGAVIIKFWVQIDKDTQLARFNERQNTPAKQWKITEEDWRNREKWDLYEGAVNEMLQKTNTSYAPWHILESNDKRYARLKALRIVIEAVERALD